MQVKKNKVSCGFIVTVGGKWLVGHVTNAKTWDVLKGVGDDDEDELETALREAREESGLDLRPFLSTFDDFGRHSYSPKKDLHLWGVELPEIDLSTLVCESMVIRPEYSFPECDGYALIDPAHRSKYLPPRLVAWINAHVYVKRLKACKVCGGYGMTRDPSRSCFGCDGAGQYEVFALPS